MSEQEDRQRRIVRGEHDEGSDETEGHVFRAEQQEPKADDESTDEVEAHHHGGRGKA